MDLGQFVQHYGYAAILIGTFFEGETILVLGALAAHLGYLELAWVIAAAFGGTLAGDQLYFFLGRRHGHEWLNKHPQWRQRTARVLELLHRHHVLLILGFRFLYGIRTVTPFAIGLSKVSTLRFAALNVIAAMIWAITIGVLGYVFGRIFELVIGEVKHYEAQVFATIAVLGTLIWTWHLLRRRRNKPR